MTTQNRCDLRRLSAGELMHPNPQWAAPDESLRAAGQRMATQGIRALLVAGTEPDALPGILTSKDIVNLLASHDADVLDRLQVRDVMTRPAICIPRQANAHDCLQLMRATGVRRLPVLDGMRVVGILSTSDLFVHLLREC
jgi:CBS domain-containing protein